MNLIGLELNKGTFNGISYEHYILYFERTPKNYNVGTCVTTVRKVKKNVLDMLMSSLGVSDLGALLLHDYDLLYDNYGNVARIVLSGSL